VIIKRLVKAHKEDHAPRLYLPQYSFARLRDESWIRLFWITVYFSMLVVAMELMLAFSELFTLALHPQFAGAPDLDELMTALGLVSFTAGMARLLLLARRTRQWIYLWGFMGFVGTFPTCAGALMDAAL
jgi:N-acetylglutamate synthase-like GNAT family acetyltransferase